MGILDQILECMKTIFKNLKNLGHIFGDQNLMQALPMRKSNDVICTSWEEKKFKIRTKSCAESVINSWTGGDAGRAATATLEVSVVCPGLHPAAESGLEGTGASCRQSKIVK